jgi:signal-transduction protein with cAMP-binding, CBS, and nucleotidyltransferase domain
MPLLLGTKGNDILKWRASAELVAKLNAGLSRKWTDSPASEAESFLGKFIVSLQDELCYEAQFLRETAALDEAIDEAASLDELHPLQARYREVASAYFRRRQSVLAFCGACNQLHDRVLMKVISLAEERMLQMGQGPAPVHALLVCGDRGRREATLHSENRYLLLHDDDTPRFFLFSRQLSAALREAGLLADERMFWHGSLREWRTLLGGSLPSDAEEDGTGSLLAPLPPFAAPVKKGAQEMPQRQWQLEAMTDLCGAKGDEDLISLALTAAARTLQQERHRAPFLELARRVIGMPLALGRFGRWRLQRNGEHRGELDLEELALGPLVMTLRILAVHSGINTCGTVDRIQALVEKGALDVELAERLLKAYQCLMQLKMLSEIRSEDSGFFWNPEELDGGAEARLRSSLEAVLNLQKITYQRIVVQG